MICCDFETTTHGKWILAGEHAVLRGHPALVFPLHAKKLTLRYQQTNSDFTVNDASMQPLLWNVLKHGMQILGQSLDNIHGYFHLDSNIPVGAGMGASASLSVAISRWFAAQNLLTSSITIQQFAKELEHLFHGQSSGLDIAGVAATSAIYFQEGVARPVKQAWQPRWFLSHCGEIGMTSPCIKTVQALWQENPEHAESIDQQMHLSVLKARSALEDTNQPQLIQAINLAADCFLQWGLISTNLQQHMQMLSDAGALAVKPTGSGGGGYVVSLWDNTPSNMNVDLIPI